MRFAPNRSDSQPVSGIRPVAEPAEPPTPAVRLIGPGMIADYELTPAAPGELTLRVVLGLGPRPLDSLEVPITVAAGASLVRPRER